MNAFALRLVAWLIALCLPLQGFAVALERVSGPAHIHVTAVAPGVIAGMQAELVRGLHELSARAATLLGPMLLPDRPTLVHAFARDHDPVHEQEHADGIGHRHHGLDEADVVYVGKTDGPDAQAAGVTPKRVLADIETLGGSTLALALTCVTAAQPPTTAPIFASRGSEPLERPPR